METRTVEVSREHPLETPYGVLYAELRSPDQITLTSGRVETRWLAGTSFSLAKGVEIGGRAYQVRLDFWRRPEGSFQLGRLGEKLRHSSYGDVWLRTRSLLNGIPIIWRLQARRDKKAEALLVAAASAAVNEWALGHPQELQAVAARELEQRRVRLRERLLETEVGLGELPGRRLRLQGEQQSLVAARERIRQELYELGDATGLAARL